MANTIKNKSFFFTRGKTLRNRYSIFMLLFKANEFSYDRLMSEMCSGWRKGEIAVEFKVEKKKCEAQYTNTNAVFRDLEEAIVLKCC